MYPTLNNGQYLIVSKIGHVFHKDVNYGDIVIIDSRVDRPRTWADDVEEPLDNYLSIFSSSAQQHNVWVKRVIGKGGDVLAFHDGHVYRNGKALNEPYINEPMEFSMDGTFTVPKGYVFVMGDNRNHSSDSRFIGPVPARTWIVMITYYLAQYLFFRFAFKTAARFPRAGNLKL